MCVRVCECVCGVRLCFVFGYMVCVWCVWVCGVCVECGVVSVRVCECVWCVWNLFIFLCV